MTKLTRYILKEVLFWYMLGFSLFVVLQMTDALSLTVGAFLDYNVGLARAAQTLGYNLPTLLNRASVLAVPFAVLLAFGRLQGDSEIKAAYAAGVRPLAMVWPLALPFLLVVGLVYLNATTLTPWASGQWYRAWYDIYGMTPAPPTREMYTYSENGSVFYAGRVQSQETGDLTPLTGPMVQRGEEIISAEGGLWNTATHEWTLIDPWIVKGDADPVQHAGELTLPQGDTLAPPPPEAERLNNTQINEELQKTGLTPTERRKLEHQLASRFADAFTAPIFALAAGLIGLLMPGRAWAFAGVLLMIVGYYVPWTLGPGLVQSGALTPLVIAWLPNGMFILLTLGLAWRMRS